MIPLKPIMEKKIYQLSKFCTRNYSNNEVISRCSQFWYSNGLLLTYDNTVIIIDHLLQNTSNFTTKRNSFFVIKSSKCCFKTRQKIADLQNMAGIRNALVLLPKVAGVIKFVGYYMHPFHQQHNCSQFSMGFVIGAPGSNYRFLLLAYDQTLKKWYFYQF